jgi:phenylacetic acid degradation operon negative regulatory protein
MTTKEGIITSLQCIGKHGFDGTTVEGPSGIAAFAKTVTLPKSEIPRVYAELKRQKLIEVKSTGCSYRFTITPNGAHRLLGEEIESIIIPSQEKWDGTWRIISYDIPRHMARERTYLNRKLHALGFTMIQRSMWAYPYPCFEQLHAIGSFLNLGRYLMAIEASNLDRDTLRRLHKAYPGLNE